MSDSLEARYAALLELAREIPSDSLPSLLGRLAEAEAIVRVRLNTVPTPAGGQKPHPDEHVAVEEAARRLGISPKYVYKHADRLPFVRRIGRRVVCSTRGLQDWSEKQRAYTPAR